MASQPEVSSVTPETKDSRFTSSVLSLMRALLESHDPGAIASRIPVARVEALDTGARDTAACPHARLDL